MMARFFCRVSSFPLLPVAPLPQVDFPTIQVTAQFPGASPETMAIIWLRSRLNDSSRKFPASPRLTSLSALGATHDHNSV